MLPLIAPRSASAETSSPTQMAASNSAYSTALAAVSSRMKLRGKLTSPSPGGDYPRGAPLFS